MVGCVKGHVMCIHGPVSLEWDVVNKGKRKIRVTIWGVRVSTYVWVRK